MPNTPLHEDVHIITLAAAQECVSKENLLSLKNICGMRYSNAVPAHEASIFPQSEMRSRLKASHAGISREQVATYAKIRASEAIIS